FSKLLLCYGFGEHHPMLGYKVQNSIHNLHLTIEAIIPFFNRYDSAEAIGCQSSLYICRPTSKSWEHKTFKVKKDIPRIYTHGTHSEESILQEKINQDLVQTLNEINTNSNKKSTFVGFDEYYLEQLNYNSTSTSLSQFILNRLDVNRKEKPKEVEVINLAAFCENFYYQRILLYCNSDIVYLVINKQSSSKEQYIS